MTHTKGRVILVSGNGPRFANQIRRQCGIELVKVNNSAACLKSITAADGDFDAVLLDADLTNGHFDPAPLKSIETKYPHIGTFITSAKKIDGRPPGTLATNGLRIPYLSHAQLKNQLGTFVQARRLKSRLGQNIAQLNTLVEFANALAATTTEAEIAEETYRCLSRLIAGVDVFHLTVNDEVHEKLRSVLLMEGNKASRKSLRSERRRSECGLEGEVVKHNRPFYVRDLKGRANLPSWFSRSAKAARSYFGLPLVSGSSVVGTISLLRQQPNAFGPSERATIQSVANQAAIALDRTLQRNWKTSHRSLILAKLYETIHAVSTALDSQEIYNLIVANLHDLFNLDFCSICLFNPGQTRLEVVSERGVGKKVIREVKDLPRALVHKVLTSTSVVKIPNVGRWPLLKKALVRKDIQSLVVLPLRGKRGPLGIINMGSKGAIHLSPEQVSLLKQLSHHAAVSIEHVQLHNETETLARKLQELGEVTLEMAKQPDLETLLKKLLDRAISLVDSTGGAIYLMSEKKGTVILEVFQGMSLKLKTREYSKGLVRAVLQRKKMVVLSDYRHWPFRRRELDHLNLTGVMGVPLVATGKILGVLVIHSDKPGRIYGNIEQKVLLNFARHAGAAIESIGRAAEDKAGAEIARALSSDVEYTKLLEKVRHVLRERLGYESFTLMNCDGKKLTVAVEAVLPARRTRTIKVGRGVSGWVARHGKVRIEPDVTKAKGYIHGLGFGSEIALPVMVGKKVIAVLDVESKKKNAFRERDVRILKRVTAGLGSAMMASRARSLANRAEAIVGAKGLEEILETIAKEMLDVCPATFCHIMLREKHDLLRVHASHAARRNKQLHWRPQQGKTCRILKDPKLFEILESKDRRVFTIEDRYGARVLSAFAEHLDLKGQLNSILLMPLRGGEGELIGLITLGELRSAMRATFTEANTRAAIAFATQAALAVEREQLLSEGPAAIGTFELKHEDATGWGPGEVERRVAKVARTSLGAEVAAVFIKKQPGYLSLEATSGSKPAASRHGKPLKISRTDGLTGYIASTGRLFNKYGKGLTAHPAVKHRGLQAHIPSGYCWSLLAVPLKRKEGKRSEVIGVLKVENKLDHRGKANPFRGFDKRDVVTMRTLAKYLETSLQNRELFSFATSLHRIGRDVNSTLDFDEVLPRVLSGLKNRIPYDTCSLQLLRGDELKVVACEGFDAADKKKVLSLSFPLTRKFPNTEVIERRCAVLHPDIRRTKFKHFWDEHDVYCAGKIRSWLGVPLLSENRPIGMLSIDSKTPAAYTETHKRYAEAIAWQVSSAVANSNVYRTTRSATDIVMDVTEEMNLQAILKKLARALVDKEGVVHADSVAIYLYQSEAERIADEVVTEGISDADVARMKSPGTKEIVTSLLLEKACANHIRINPAPYAKVAQQLQARTTAALRLAVGDQLVGLMLLHFHFRHSFEKMEEDLLRLVADKASLSIQHAWMFEQVQRRFETAKLAAVSLNAMSAWAHDAKKHNFWLALTLEELKKRSEHLDPAAKECLEEAIQYSTNVTSIPTPPGDVETMGPVSLAKVFDAVKQRYETDLGKKQIQIEDNLEKLPLVMGSEWLLAEALKHLTQNAIKALPPGGKITLSGQVKSRRVYLSFTDNGGGIEPAVRDILFQRRIPSPNENEFGVGLLLSRMYLDAVNGDLKLKETSHRGTTFVLNVPIAEQSSTL